MMYREMGLDHGHEDYACDVGLYSEFEPHQAWNPMPPTRRISAYVPTFKACALRVIKLTIDKNNN